MGKNYTLLITIRYIPGEKYNSFFFILSLTRLRYTYIVIIIINIGVCIKCCMDGWIYLMMRYTKKKLFFFFSLKRDLSTLSLYNMLYYYSLTRFAVCINSISFFVSFPFRYDDVIIFRRQTGIMSSVFFYILFLMGLYTFKLNIYCYSYYFSLSCCWVDNAIIYFVHILKFWLFFSDISLCNSECMEINR